MTIINSYGPVEKNHHTNNNYFRTMPGTRLWAAEPDYWSKRASTSRVHLGLQDGYNRATDMTEH